MHPPASMPPLPYAYLQAIDFIDVMLSSLILFDSMEAELSSVVSFKTSYNSSIQWLDKQCHIWLEIHQLNVSRFIADKMAGKVVNHKAYMLLLGVHLYIKIFDISGMIKHMNQCWL
jgi:hypothetical protein